MHEAHPLFAYLPNSSHSWFLRRWQTWGCLSLSCNIFTLPVSYIWNQWGVNGRSLGIENSNVFRAPLSLLVTLSYFIRLGCWFHFRKYLVVIWWKQGSVLMTYPNGGQNVSTAPLTCISVCLSTLTWGNTADATHIFTSFNHGLHQGVCSIW